MSTQDKTPQDEKAVDDVLDDAGQKLRALFKKNAEDLRKMTIDYTALLESSAAKESTNTAFLTKQYTDLGVALGLHTPIATASNNGEQVSPAAVKEALAATEVAKQNELKWKAKVDSTLADLDERTTSNTKRIDVLEGKDEVPTLASVSAPVPSPEPKVVEPEPKVVTIEPNKPDQTVVAPPAQPVVVRYINPKTWGGLAWALAIIGAIIFGIDALWIQGSFFPGTPEPLQWIRWATLWLFPLFGLFAGGAIGSRLEARQLGSKTTTVA